MSMTKFLSPFFSPEDIVNLRIFPDRKAEDIDFKGKKYAIKLSEIEALMPTLMQHNNHHRSICFIVNSGGDNDTDITRINAQSLTASPSLRQSL